MDLEQHDYDQKQFEDDCFTINAIPLRLTSEASSMKKFPEDLIYAYLCEVKIDFFRDEIEFIADCRHIQIQRYSPQNYVLFIVFHRKNRG